MYMIKTLINSALVNGEKATLIPINRLQNVRNEIERFGQNNNELNDFQKWIVNDMYKFDIPNTEFSVRSILLIAIPHPFGEPDQSSEKEGEVREKLVKKALEALTVDIRKQTVFE